MNLLFLITLFFGIIFNLFYIGGFFIAKDKLSYLLRYPLYIRHKNVENGLRDITLKMRYCLLVIVVLMIANFVVTMLQS